MKRKKHVYVTLFILLIALILILSVWIYYERRIHPF